MVIFLDRNPTYHQMLRSQGHYLLNRPAEIKKSSSTKTKYKKYIRLAGSIKETMNILIMRDVDVVQTLLRSGMRSSFRL